MVTHMDKEDVEAQLEPTFFVIAHHWPVFDAGSRERASGLLRFLMTNYQDVIEAYGAKLPSLGHIEELSEVLSKLDAVRRALDEREQFDIFTQRLKHENPGVVLQTLNELSIYLGEHQGYLQASAVSQQPDMVVTGLMRAVLDCAFKYNGSQGNMDIAGLCADCVGLLGCLDSNRLETMREQKEFVVIQNFADASETTNFVAFLLENVLVKAFLSTTDLRLQGFLSYTMQELLDRCDFKAACQMQAAGRQTDMSAAVYRKWLSLSDSTREALTPFLTSKFLIAPLPHNALAYPVFRPGKPYAAWLRSFVLDLLRHGQNLFAQIIFEPLCRVIKVKDVLVPQFLLPHVVLHVVIGQDSGEFTDKVTKELLDILEHSPSDKASYTAKEEAKAYYEVRTVVLWHEEHADAKEIRQAVFRILDHLRRWLQLRRPQPNLQTRDLTQMQRVQDLIASLPPDVLSARAVQSGQYARALFFLEPYLYKDGRLKEGQERSEAYRSLQQIYAEIDEPDALEGLFAIMPQHDLAQQTQGHRKAGRWTAAQTWYEVQLAERPGDVKMQQDLLTCLRQSGQHDVLLNYVEGIKPGAANLGLIAPFAVEAAWVTGRWESMEKYMGLYEANKAAEAFNLGIGQALLYLKGKQPTAFRDQVKDMKVAVATTMTQTTTSSLHAAHEAMLKCHVLKELEMIAEASLSLVPQRGDREGLLTSLSRRLEVLGAYVGDKQYVLGIRRAAMELTRPAFSNEDISPLWLASAKLARKAGSRHQSFNAVLRAQKLGDAFALIENSKLLWRDGHHRKAIQGLERAVHEKVLRGGTGGASKAATGSSIKPADGQAKLLTARAHLLLAKWLDSSGQTNAVALRMRYQQAAQMDPHWEKGHYYLGRHYKKVLESEKALRLQDQSDGYLMGETAKLVIENYVRSLHFGTKYLYQTLPRILTLWLDLAAQVDKPPEGKVTLSAQLRGRRRDVLQELHASLNKYFPRLPAYVFYTSLPQIVARIVHPHPDVYAILEFLIVRVVEKYPRQALWSTLNCMPSKQLSDRPADRRARGTQVWTAIRNRGAAGGRRADGGQHDLGTLCRMGEKVAEQLLLACVNGDFQSNKTCVASITRDLRFNHKCTPCALVVPVEACLTATLPTRTDEMKKHKPFSRDVVSIDSFEDDVLVLGSLAKPRKLTARGSDGKRYGLLVKPKDDLRTDQRLMEFNGIINRALKRDAESSRRQLYVRTYAVTPLNEECGIIDWVDGLRTLRDILLGLYKTRSIYPNYQQIQQLMNQAKTSESLLSLFTHDVMSQFPPVLPDWFISQFPSPSAWFAARVKYTRSCAVMSMVGTILGLGDRHGENVLLEEGNGGLFHVDFNCLFDKGLTFAQPERVPFRLTRNMQAAMGPYHHEGPFRQCCELTLRVLRQQEETLMTILEAFIYDPTLDLQRDKKKRDAKVNMNPTNVVESIRRKVRGLLPNESIPLGVEGQVEELIQQATDPRNLTAMYIGWCPFL